MGNEDSSSYGQTSCLVTGGSGYLGNYIVDHLRSLNWKVDTLGRNEKNTFTCDLSSQIPNLKSNYDLVIHCAGKAHFFPKSKKEAINFTKVNVNGTLNLLKALENQAALPKCIVFMSSVSVYGAESGTLIKEDHPLKAEQAYGWSKIEAERVIINWCLSHQVRYLIFRLPLLAGKKPPGNLKAMINSINRGYYVNFFGDVRKSIVMADDVAKIVPLALEKEGIFNLTDGFHPTVTEISKQIALQLNKPIPKVLPNWCLKCLVKMVNKLSFIAPITAYKFLKLNKTLTFDDAKARNELGWNPKPVLEAFEIQ